MREIKFKIPMLIDMQLTPNRSRHVHWGTITRLKKELQEQTYYSAHEAKRLWETLNSKVWEPGSKALISYRFFIPDNRHKRDDDNAIAGLKHLRDVLQDGLGVYRVGLVCDDRCIITSGVDWVVDKKRAPLTEITLRIFESE